MSGDCNGVSDSTKNAESPRPGTADISRAEGDVSPAAKYGYESHYCNTAGQGAGHRTAQHSNSMDHQGHYFESGKDALGVARHYPNHGGYYANGSRDDDQGPSRSGESSGRGADFYPGGFEEG